MKNAKLLRFLIPIIAVSTVIILSIIAFHDLPTKISPDASKEECLKRASEYIQKDQPESAIYPLLLAIQKDQNDAQAHFLLAQSYYQTQVYSLARRECETALLLEAQNRKALDLLIHIRFEQGKKNWDRGDLNEALTQFVYVLNTSQNQRLIDSIANLTGGKYRIKRLTNDLFMDNAPSFSHDGKRIIYHSDTSYFLKDYGLKKMEVKKSRIFVTNLNGENKTCLSSSERDDTSEQFARFSGDDKKMVYEKENQYPEQKDPDFNLDRDIFMKDLDTGKLRRLTNNDTYDGLASFSPDDRRILFVCGYSGGGSSIFILDLDTGEKRRVFFKESLMEKITRRSRGLVLPYCPSFSPDGEKILFHAGYETRQIFIMDEHGESLRCLTTGQTDDFFPAFSPNGQKIVFVSSRNGQENLFLVNSDGSNRSKLTYDGGQKKYPSFSPDGNLIAFAAKQKDQDDRYYEIYILNLKETISKERLIQRLEEMLRTFL